MEFDHGLDQGQSKSGPFVTALQMVLQLDEGLHDPVDILRSYPDAGIADPHLQPAGGIVDEGDGDPPDGVNFTALLSRLSRICRSIRSSARTRQLPAGRS
jgi:hypothetical protein